MTLRELGVSVLACACVVVAGWLAIPREASQPLVANPGEIEVKSAVGFERPAGADSSSLVELLPGNADGARARVRSALATADPSEQELRSWYEAHRELFGTRSFEQSRSAIAEIVRVEKARLTLRTDAP